MTQKHKRGIIIVLLLIGLFVLLRFLGVFKYFSFEYLKAYSEYFKEFLQEYYWSSVAIFVGIFALLIAAGFPSVAPLTLLGGFLFGTFSGALYAVVGGTLGSFVTFLVIRYIFGAALQKKYHERLVKFNKHVEEHGVSYLLMLHFLSVVPYVVINSLAALTNVSLWTFLWTTIVGSAPIALIYSYAGVTIGSIRSVRDIFSPSLIILMFLLILISLMPIIIKRYRKMMSKTDEGSLL